MNCTFFIAKNRGATERVAPDSKVTKSRDSDPVAEKNPDSVPVGEKKPDTDPILEKNRIKLRIQRPQIGDRFDSDTLLKTLLTVCPRHLVQCS